MTRTALTRIVSLVCLAAVFAMPALAQDAEPLPAAPEGYRAANVTESADDSSDREIIIIIPLAAQPTYPLDNSIFTANSSFAWTAVGATDYTIKIKVLETGKKITFKPTYTCTPYSCNGTTYGTDLFDQLQDGQTISWQVISHYTAGKFKSAKFTATIDEVTAGTPTEPANGSTVAKGGPMHFGWGVSGTANNRYVVTVKDMSLNMVVYTRMMSASSMPIGDSQGCWTTSCKLEVSYADLSVTFVAGHSYEWTVTAIGATGEKAKSAKATFTVQ